ncbi:hypothetical protein LOK49_LG10G02562 [Camellia lanceoleosa]|uniref:Uncharacterized protein n=1 Tax=Camellia lanceoleosa TaxID=1840588 RepID=A0ACC0G8R0_9ERIC|nr:hypothetical protein LOK49_LG10G02562 [Camellia lanceoleosa]
MESLQGDRLEFPMTQVLNSIPHGRQLQMNVEACLLLLRQLRGHSKVKESLHGILLLVKYREYLEMLSFAGSRIKELPKEIIGHLDRVKVLDLLNCTVERIYPGVLSSLSMLEELYVGNSFQTMDGIQERTEMTNAIIVEVASLSHLVALDIVLFILPRDWVINKVGLQSMNVTDLRDGSSLKMLYQSTKILELDSVKGLKNFLSDLDEYSFEHLMELTLQKCDDLEYLINTPDDKVLQIAFPFLC